MSVVQAYFLVGPTAVGKSAVAQYIAEQYGYDILAADSMQVYRGMDLGTDKPSAAERNKTRHYGIDIVDPCELFSVGIYRRSALAVLKENSAAEHVTVVVGGTGLYIKSLIDGLDTAPAVDRSVKIYWESVHTEKGIGALQDALRCRDPNLYERIRDKKNARRLIRALELLETGARVGGRAWDERSPKDPLPGLIMPTDVLQERIAVRVGRMYKSGRVEEVKNLMDAGVVMSETARHAIGYAEAIDYLNGRCSREDAMARTVVRTRQLAKKQRTWFRHQLNVQWIEVTAAMETGKIAQKVLEHWRKYGPTKIAE